MKINRPVVREWLTFLKSQLAVPPWSSAQVSRAHPHRQLADVDSA